MKSLLSIIVLVTGVSIAWKYLRFRPDPNTRGSRTQPGVIGVSDRPWRRLGAAICLTTAVMFVLGIYLINPERNPAAVATYWLVILLLVVWLCLLAVKDMLHTRRELEKWRDERRADIGWSNHADESHDEAEH
ncbi:MAG: hypothetical protein ACYTHJ_02765 [Planctomycetota bacterium]|jgi:amino acid permease